MFEHACKLGLEGIVSKHRYREAVENILRIMETARSRAGVELLIERPLECGARLSEMTLRSATNQPTGLIDLGKVECADRQFWASFSELEQARTGTTRREWSEIQNGLCGLVFTWLRDSGVARRQPLGFVIGYAARCVSLDCGLQARAINRLGSELC